MNIYNQKDYRRIYQKHYGKIPKDKDGRSYEIHHIDGNHNNNKIHNLKLVSIQEHYDIHHAQGDWAACLSMAKRMAISPEEKSKLASLSNQKRLADGTHPFLNPELAKSRWAAIKESGHNPWGTVEYKENQRKQAQDRLDNGTHNFLGDNNPSKRLVKQGTHNFQGSAHAENMLAQGKHPSQKRLTCEHCSTTVSSGMFARWHGDNCRNKSIS